MTISLSSPSVPGKIARAIMQSPRAPRTVMTVLMESSSVSRVNFLSVMLNVAIRNNFYCVIFQFL
jgi:hypothetical protein